jgi:CheY-like chemotaxis protein
MKRKSRAVAEAGGDSALDGLEAPSVTILHVDDDPNDTELLRAAVRKAALDLTLHNVEDAEHAIAYLSGQGIYADRGSYCLPALILLDLKMPRVTGFEVLRWIRQHPKLNRLPVVVLSGSELQDDIRQAYDSGANSYLVKPLGFEALVQMVKRIHTAWTLGAVAKPQRSNRLLFTVL